MLTQKPLYIPEDKILELCEKYPTPFYVYDERSMQDNLQDLYRAFSWNKGFKNYFAVKACPNPSVVASLKKAENIGLDCSSYTELLMAERLQIRGEDIMFTSNNTPVEDMKKAIELGAVINLDDISHIEFLNKECGGLPALISQRYNPGKLKAGNAIIGKPEEAKYGFTREQYLEGFKQSKSMGCKRFGMHTMVVSNELNAEYFVDTAVMLFNLATEIKQKLGIAVEFINLGGGIGIPYTPEQYAPKYLDISKGVEEAYKKIIAPAGLDVALKMENGRTITGPYGYLISKVIHKKETYKHYVGLDACMANLMRPGMYGAYHHISILGKKEAQATHIYDVTGSLCENNDKFAIDRALPQVDIGDIAILHDVGAHGHSMGFNYNGKLRSAEILLRSDGTHTLIRRAETPEDYFRTIIW